MPREFHKLTPDIILTNILFCATQDLNGGTTEIPRGSNSSPRIDKMLSYCGLSDPNPWCAAAGSTWVAEALSFSSSFPISADCDVFLQAARNNGSLRTIPKVGDFFLLLRSDDDAFHTGIVVSCNGASFTTIEGNSNDSGGHEGHTVITRTRNTSDRRVVFFSPADFSFKQPRERRDIPILTIDGKIFHSPYNFRDQRLYAHAASFLRLVKPDSVITREVVWNSGITSMFSINAYGYARVRDMAKLWCPDRELGYDETMKIASL